MSDDRIYTFYFGGELFSSKHLLGNAALAEAIRHRSGGRFQALLPQALEQRDTSAQAIRDQDIRALLACDLGLFNYDGPELDSGTVVEFMFAKFADIPSVLLRTDFRGSGDQAAGGEPWNLMTSFYPRTFTVLLDAMALYQKNLVRPQSSMNDFSNSSAAQRMIENTADMVIDAFDRLLSAAPILPAFLREPVYQWLALMPGFGTGQEQIAVELLDQAKRKQEAGLL